MFRLITIEREYGCGGGAIAAELATALDWKLWDRLLTEEIARLANVDCSAVCAAKSAWTAASTASPRLSGAAATSAFSARQSGLRCRPHGFADGADRSQNCAGRQCVVVGRGAPYFLREQPDAFHVFLYAPRAEKLQRLLQDECTKSEAEDLVDTVDRERIAFVKHYFDADWPTRSLYHVMINTAVGNEAVIQTILNTMHLVEGSPKATDYERPKVPSSI
jgi:cytidylate kinase